MIKKAINKKATSLLRISAPASLANQVLRPIFAEFAKKHPAIKLHLKVTDRVLNQIHDTLDVLIQINDKPIESLVNIKIGKIKHVLCASTLYLQKNGTPIHPKQLNDFEYIFLNESNLDGYWHFTKDDQNSTVKLNESNLVNHNGVLQHSIEQGLGIGYLPDFTATKGIKNKLLVPIMEDWELQNNDHSDIYLQFTPSKEMPQKNLIFVDFIKNAISKID